MSNAYPKLSLHLLRSLPPHCVNRDENGVPKSSYFGGTLRGRVSSQAQKRAVRTSPDLRAAGPVAVRTREAYKLLVEPLVERGHDAEEAWKVIAAFLPVFFVNIGKNAEDVEDDRHIAGAVMAMSPDEVVAVIAGLHSRFDAILAALPDGQESAEEKEKPKKGKKKESKESPTAALAKELTERFQGWTSAVDIALFARMVSGNDNLEIAGAAQVAQMISTHAAPPQKDYYTSLDDLADNAAMIGETLYAAGVYYQNVNLDWRQLLENLAGDEALAVRAVRALVRSTVLTLPRGRRSTYFADSLPGLVVAEIRKGGIYSLANAFEQPVQSREGLMGASVKALAAYWPFVNRMAGQPAAVVGLAGAPEVEAALNETYLKGAARWAQSLDEFVECAVAELRAQ